MSGKITFVGAGPGDPELITLKGAAALREADTVIYAGSLVNEKILEMAPRAEFHNSAKMALEEVLKILTGDYRAGKKVVRLHTGDPSVYGAVGEQFRELDRAGIPYTVIPGVSSVFAAAAALQTELTMPEISQTVILTRDAGRTPVPAGEELTSLAAHGSTLCLFLSVSDMEKLCGKLLAAGRPPETAAAVVYRASWENEVIVRGTIGDIARKVEAAGIKRQAIIVIGDVLRKEGALSKLYDAEFATGYRHHRFRGRAGLFALTRQASLKAAEIASGLSDAVLFVPEKYAEAVPSLHTQIFGSGKFGETLTENWHSFDAFIFVMAAGIAVRHIGKLCEDKKTDPAAVVCDEKGNFAVSLLSGHTGGGNALARDVARITGGQPVITTASDVQGLPAFDVFAREHHCVIETPETLTAVASAVVNGEPVSAEMRARLFEAELKQYPGVTLSRERNDGIILIRAGGHELRLRQPRFTLGIGCRKGIGADRIAEVVREVLEKNGFYPEDLSMIASAEVKKDEPGLLEFAAKMNLPLRFYAAAELNSVEVPNPSEAAEKHLGIKSVSEASAVLSAGRNGRLYVEKQRCGDVTVAIAGDDDESQI
ncbi:MAG: precorrin-4 C(11)-methyltransferase [Lentisphaeria bacterium]|nr:precorrin-4 C(11)-methyltransferase [Lentisphaeria bacterium]